MKFLTLALLVFQSINAVAADFRVVLTGKEEDSRGAFVTGFSDEHGNPIEESKVDQLGMQGVDKTFTRYRLIATETSLRAGLSRSGPYVIEGAILNDDLDYPYDDGSNTKIRTITVLVRDFRD